MTLGNRRSAFGETTFAWPRRESWRRGRDSNPWYPSGYNGFQDRRLKPLGHLSMLKTLGSSRVLPGRVRRASSSVVGSVAGGRVELGGCRPQVAVAHDRVTAVYRLGFM